MMLCCQYFVIVTAIAFDFMQNLPVSYMIMSKTFYSRQVWHYDFDVHNVLYI
jgi:hypothetical protein